MKKEPNDVQGHDNEPPAGEEAGEERGLSLTDQLAALRDELEESRREASQNLDAAQRAQADLVNYRRRADEERISLGRYSTTRLIAKVLPVMEELDLAVAHAEQGGPTASWLEGVKLIQRKLLHLLESEGVTEIETVGVEFNPVEHEALGTVETAQYPPGCVTEAVRPGYRLHDRVIQPAQVMVAREP
tara:strand:+ start:268 stop:831 length:564 start_codon:yes stop_codon:yes gene_type:complete